MNLSANTAKVTVLDAPSNLGLRPPRPGVEPGCGGLASALRSRGIVERLAATDAGSVVPPTYSPEWDGRTTRNAAAIAGYSQRLAERTERLLTEGHFPLVLGGDCSILLGNALALRRKGRFGLAFLDGHLDFRHPDNTETMSAAAGEDLALVTGRGDPLLTDPDGLRPLVRDTDVYALCEREGDPVTGDILETEITVVDLDGVRAGSVTRAALECVETFEGSGVDGFWIHLDADVLDGEVMPAVDSPQPDGLSFAELTEMLRILLDSNLAAGMEVTIFDPTLDPDSSIGSAFADCLVRAFGR